MNPQEIFNYVVTSFAGLITWLFHTLWGDVQSTKAALGKFKEEIAKHRVHKDDLKDLSEAIFRKLDRIEDKLDSKQDKGHP